MKKSILFTGLRLGLAGAVLTPQIYYKLRRKKSINNFTHAYKNKKNYTVSDNIKVDKVQNDLTLTNVDGFNVQTSIYEPKEIKAVVHIVHGSLEHRSR